MTIDRTELAALIRPFIPDPHPMFLQIFHVGIARQEPKKLVYDRFQMKFLRRQQRKTFVQRKAHLIAEHRQGAGTRAVVLFRTAAKDEFHQVEILAHRSSILLRLGKVGKFTPDDNSQHAFINDRNALFYFGRGPNLIVLLGIAMIFDRILIARLLFSLVTVGWGVLTVVADFNRTHATNPAWTPHARFHVVWQVLSYVGFGLLAFALIWRPGPLAIERLYLLVLMGAILYAAFFAALIAMPIYGGTVRGDRKSTRLNSSHLG